MGQIMIHQDWTSGFRGSLFQFDPHPPGGISYHVAVLWINSSARFRPSETNSHWLVRHPRHR
jgi:hypothetical protein